VYGARLQGPVVYLTATTQSEFSTYKHGVAFHAPAVVSIVQPSSGPAKRLNQATLGFGSISKVGLVYKCWSLPTRRSLFQEDAEKKKSADHEKRMLDLQERQCAPVVPQSEPLASDDPGEIIIARKLSYLFCGSETVL
jgi:hypothetical protein